jgi:hypothetical protein
MIRKLLVLGGVSLAAISASSMATAALAYEGQQGPNFQCESNSAAPGASKNCTSTFKDANGNAIAGANVTFAQQSGPAGCTVTFSPTSATTNASGQATTSITLPKGCPGQYVLTATANGQVLSVTVTETGGFPVTTGEPTATSPPIALVLMALGIAFIVAASSVLVLRRRR